MSNKYTVQNWLEGDDEGYKDWTNAEKEFLEENYNKYANSKILSEELKKVRGVSRTANEVRSMAHQLGLTGTAPGAWTDKENDILKKHYADSTYEEISAFIKEKLDIDRTPTAVYHQCRKLGLVTKNKDINKKNYDDTDLINVLRALSNEIAELKSLTALDPILKEKKLPRLNTFKRRLGIKTLDDVRNLVNVESKVLNEKVLKVNFNKGGNAGYSAKITLPITWVRQLGLDQDNREVKVTFLAKEGKIIIEKN